MPSPRCAITSGTAETTGPSTGRTGRSWSTSSTRGPTTTVFCRPRQTGRLTRPASPPALRQAGGDRIGAAYRFFLGALAEGQEERPEGGSHGRDGAQGSTLDRRDHRRTGRQRVPDRELETDRPAAEAVRRFLSARRRRRPTGEELRSAIRSKPFYWSCRPQQRSYILRRFEESYRPGEPVDFAKATLSLEHILPQKPSRAWYDLLVEETEDGQPPQEMHDLLVHTLGNLTLTGDNSKLTNHPFQRKQQILDSSALRMNLEIASSERWGKAEIHARADSLSERAVELWPGPIGGILPVGEEWAGWAELRAALVTMPSGSWTSYGDVAELIGSHPVPVGAYLGSNATVIGA
ncbi:DUF1524 domain-containing protein [Streptomyces sp. NPDC058439]|uniref:GmrSD restriction endonuclease domain-containing protein n=1 Tax=Streptomyces sp. NPDC058439 TaxID=3346500 RepID=UPI003652C2E7